MNKSNNILLKQFLSGHLTQMSCPQCENTFLTNVYQIRDATVPGMPEDAPAGMPFVLLEKHALGLEYFCDAINAYGVQKIPYTRRIAILSENDALLDPSVIRLFSLEEPDYRLVYVMEYLEHLSREDRLFFDEHVHELDWMDEQTRFRIFDWMAERYGADLARDVRLLCRYFRAHETFLSWDLHGNNLMRRPSTGELVILDPFALKT
ncbi:MAG TPA: hypothetical protein PLB10_06220 [Thiolinea sp.]|nr:hypothetical protein [Thiolinea sp.]